MSLRKTFIAAIGLCTAQGLAVADAVDAADADEPDMQRCINTRVISHTNVANDRNIVFEMVGKRLYLNTLPKNCKGLAAAGRFTYATYSGNLCRNDQINVLRQSGLGLYRGRVCRLGEFRAVTEEELLVLFERGKSVPQSRPVEAPQIQEVVDEEQAEEDTGGN